MADADQVPLDKELGMRLVREALEGVFEPKTVSAVIFEALAAEQPGELPSDRAAVVDFARSSVRWAVEARLGERAAADFVSHFDVMLARFAEPVIDPEITATTQLDLGLPDGPVPILVLSANPVMSLALQGALTYQLAKVEGAEGLEAAYRVSSASRPKILVIDALMPVTDQQPDVIEFLASATWATTRLIWGSDQPWGRNLAVALSDRAISQTPIDSGEGVEPVLDLVRARCVHE